MPQFSDGDTLNLLMREFSEMKSQLAEQQAEIARLKAYQTSNVLPSLVNEKPTSRRGMLKTLAVGAATLGMAGIALTANGMGTVYAETPEVGDSSASEVPGALLPPAPTSPGTFYKSVSGFAFKPEANTSIYDIGTATGQLELENTSTDNEFLFLLELPQGAVITEVLWYFTKPTAGGNFDFELRRIEPSSGNFITLYSDSTSAAVAGTAIQLLTGTATGSGTLANRTVDNSAYNYSLQAQLPFVAGQNFLFYGVRVGYTLPFGSQTYFLSTPIRVAASTNSGGTLALLTSNGNTANPDSTAQVVQITGVVVNALSVPVGARAIICSVTSVGATTSGNLRLYPDGATAPTVNSLNIPVNAASPTGAGLNLTTAVIVSLSSAGRVKIAYNNATANSTCGFSIDVVGYML
jgi:hypothetical protein